MITLTYGYKKPQAGDTGDVFFPALEGDIQQVNDHTHDGTTSALLASTTQTIASGSWSAGTGGLYSQTVTLPGAYSYDQCDMWFQLSTGERMYPTVSRISATQYTIYCNDNTVTIKAFYR